MDFFVPPRDVGEPNSNLSPKLQLLEQWIRYTIGSVAGLTATAPLLRGTMLHMVEREHRKQSHFVAGPQGPYLPFGSTVASIKATWSIEGFRSFFRGMGALYTTTPIRAVYHLLAFDLIENPIIPGGNIAKLNDHKRKLAEVASSRGSQNANDRDHNQTTAATFNWGLSESNPSTTLNPKSPISKSAYLLATMGIILAGEFVLYPARYLFTRLSGDLLGGSRTIVTNRTSTLFLQVVRQDGLMALYRGFLPCLLAIAIPTLIYADFRYDVCYDTQLSLDRPSPRAKLADSYDWETLDPIFGGDDSIQSKRAAEVLLRKMASLVDHAAERREQLSNEWAITAILTFPFIIAHARMATGPPARIPNDFVISWLAPQRWPTVRMFMASCMAWTSTTPNVSLRPTMFRILQGGPESAYSSFFWLIFARVLFITVSEFTADLSAWPLNLYFNHTLYGIWSPFHTDITVKAKKEMEQLETRRLEAERRLIAGQTSFDEARHNKMNLEDDLQNNPRYQANDDALRALGLEPLQLPKKEREHSSKQPRVDAVASLTLKQLEEMDLDTLRNQKPSDRISAELSLPASIVPSEEEHKTQFPIDAPIETPKKVSPKPVPLLSQKPVWYADYSRGNTSKPL
jgi:hypothetical protein